MAEKRMFTKKITDSDAFLEMPLSAQCLYFHLNMNADDDGFVNSPKRTMKLIGASEDDLKLLFAKAFVLGFDSGVIVIKHWRMHNTLQKDRYKPTDYQEEFAQLGFKKNKSYTWAEVGNGVETKCIQDVSIDKNRLDKSRLDKNSLDDDEENIRDRFLESGEDEWIVDRAITILKSFGVGFDQTLLGKTIAICECESIANPEGYIYEMLKQKGVIKCS